MEEGYTSIPSSHLLGSIPAAIPEEKKPATNEGASAQANMQNFPPTNGGYQSPGAPHDIFFKQHGWTDGGKIEAKYTSKDAELYRQILSKEVSKSMADDIVLPSSPVASQPPVSTNGFPELKLPEKAKESSIDRHETPEVTRSPKAPIHSAVIGSMKKPIGARIAGSKFDGLGVRKLITKFASLKSKAMESADAQASSHEKKMAKQLIFCNFCTC